jgi:DNA polymerase-3 subunit alpha
MSNGTTNVDSITKFDEYIEKAKELNMKALCFTEHGNLFSWVYKKQHIESAGMKYMHGIEAYITETLETKVRDNYHCILIARNFEGVKELNLLSSKSFNRKDNHFYYMPRISIDELTNTSPNIIISTACLGGILHNGNDAIKDKFITFLVNNKDRCFLEIQHHNDIDGEQKAYNQYLYELSKSIGVRLVTGTDTHALNNEHMDGRSILQKAKGVNFANEGSWDLTFKSYEELVEAYKKQNSLPLDVVLNAINNTNVIADMVEPFELDKSYKYPHLWEHSEKTFQQKIMQGLKDRGVDKYPNYQEYVDRIKYELNAYRHNGAIDFMLLMADIIEWCNDNDVKVGYGRGSVNGSVIAWLLGITEMDSIKHKLYFDRFMNLERVSLSDIDTDFPPSRIDDVKKYIFSKTGLYCCDIVTFNTVALKGAIRDVGRALQMSLEEVGAICDEVEFKEDELRKKYKTLFKYVDLVNGTIVSVGSHPCGMVTSPFEIEDSIGTFTTSTSEYPISQINMKEIDGLNYVKLDLLRLDTIELINETCKLAEIERLTPDNVDITDVKVWDAIRDDTTQIFQWEGNTGNDYIKKLLSDDNIKNFQEINENLDRMTLLSIGNSAIRPAGASYRDDLGSGVVRKIGNVAIDKFLSSTFGYLVFQEQIIEFLHSYCGYTMGEADVVRRGFAKKTGTEQHIPRIKEGFIKTMTETYGYSVEKAEQDILAFVQVIEDASSYLFSLNHSQPYSFEGYVSGWLRYYYPLEFLTVALNINKDKEEKTNGLTAYAKKVGIKIKPPRFRRSKATYFCDKDDNSIYKGIGSIKFMNNQIADELYDLRENQYADFLDVLLDIKNKTHVNSRQLTILVQIEFFKEYGGINELLHCVKIYDELSDKSQIKKDSIETLGISENEVRIFSANETDTRIEEIDCVKFIKSLGYIDEQVEEQLTDCVKYKYIANEKEEKEKIPNGYSSNKVIKKYEMTKEQIINFASKTIVGKFYDININELIRYIVKNVVTKPCSLPQKIKYQLEHLGYIDYVDESYEWRYVIVTKLNTQYSPKFVAYSINNGKMVEMKVSKKRDGRDKTQIVSFNEVPFVDGDVLYIRGVVKKQKTKKTDEGFVPVPNVYDWWIKDYVKLGDVDVR